MRVSAGQPRLTGILGLVASAASVGGVAAGPPEVGLVARCADAVAVVAVAGATVGALAAGVVTVGLFGCGCCGGAVDVDVDVDVVQLGNVTNNMDNVRLGSWRLNISLMTFKHGQCLVAAFHTFSFAAVTNREHHRG